MKIGIERLISDLHENGYETATQAQAPDGTFYAVIPEFIIPGGSFADRVISLAIPAPANYPQGVGASIHIKALPVLSPVGSIPGKRNVIASSLGGEWQYWSYKFNLYQNNPTGELIAQINGIFNQN